MGRGRQIAADVLRNFLYSAGQSFGAAAQAPRGRQGQAAIAAGLQAPFQLQELDRIRAMEEEDRRMRGEQLRSALASQAVDRQKAIFDAISGTPALQAIVRPAPYMGTPDALQEPPSQTLIGQGHAPVEIGGRMATPPSAQEQVMQRIQQIRAQQQAEQEFAPPRPISFPAPRAEPQPTAAIQEYNFYAAQEMKAGRQPKSFNEYQEMDANRRTPAAAQSLIPGRDIPLPADVEAQRLRMNATRAQAGRPVGTGDAGRISDIKNGLGDVANLRKEIPAGTTGAAAAAGAALPSFITEATGIGMDAKKKQAVIDRVKQVIGKTLEGGVLRKEDEEKYAKILPTIKDPDAIVKTKLDGLERAIQQKLDIFLDSLEDSGFDVSKHRKREAEKPTGRNNTSSMFGRKP